MSKSMAMAVLSLTMSAACSAAQPGMTELQSETFIAGVLFDGSIVETREEPRRAAGEHQRLRVAR